MVKDIWDILGIEETKDIALINQVYREQLKTVNIKTDEVVYLTLKKAYDEALKFAQTSEEQDRNQIRPWFDRYIPPIARNSVEAMDDIQVLNRFLIIHKSNQESLNVNKKLLVIYDRLYRELEDIEYYKRGKQYVDSILEIEVSASTYYNIGCYYLSGYEILKALKSFEQARQENENSSLLFNSMGEVYVLQRKMKGAIEAFSRSMELVEQQEGNSKSDCEIQYRNLAKCYEILGEFDKSYAQLNKILEKFPDRNYIQLKKINLLSRMRKHEKAMEECKLLSQCNDPKIALEATFLLYTIYKKMEKEKEAKELEKVLCKQHKLDRKVNHFKACLYYDNGNLKKALDCRMKTLEDMEEVDPDYIEYMLKLALIHYSLKQKNKSIKYATMVLDNIISKYSSIEGYIGFLCQKPIRCYNLGLTYLCLDKLGKAEEYFTLAITSIPCKNCKTMGCFEGYFGLGLVYEAKGDKAKAKSNYEKSLSYNNNSLLCQRHMAKII